MTFLSLVVLHWLTRLSCGPRIAITAIKTIRADRRRGRVRRSIQFRISKCRAATDCVGSVHVRDDAEATFEIGPRIRRIFEFVAAATSVILLAPIFLVTAIAIKLNSSGLIFIREPKFGYGNQRIQLIKFQFASARGDGNLLHIEGEIVKLSPRPVLMNSRSCSM